VPNCPNENPTKSYSFETLAQAEYFMNHYELKHNFVRVELINKRHPAIDSIRMEKIDCNG